MITVEKREIKEKTRKAKPNKSEFFQRAINAVKYSTSAHFFLIFFSRLYTLLRYKFSLEGNDKGKGEDWHIQKSLGMETKFPQQELLQSLGKES